MWFDKWHPNGPLSKLIDHRMIYLAGLDINAKICDMINDNSWCWPIDWEGDLDSVIDVPVPHLINDLEDKIVWCNKNGEYRSFSVSEVWKAIKLEYPKVIWHKHVWFSQCIPKHAFTTWIAIRGRLKTLDRMSKWFNVQDKVCCL